MRSHSDQRLLTNDPSQCWSWSTLSVGRRCYSNAIAPYTGSLKWPDESAPDAAYRELEEETGIKAVSGWQNWQHTYTFPILPEYRHRYAPGVSDNQEHLFSLELPETCQPVLSDAEHSSGLWLPIEDAITKVWSWSNRDALERVAAALNSD